jgi:pyruvate dehydrogenase (quinone)
VPQTSDFVLERLREWGVHRVFAYPGDGINGMLGAFGRAGGDPGPGPTGGRGT